jgi:hypothetical protein
VGARLALVGVDDEIGRLLRVGLHEAPLHAHREAGAAATAEVGLLGLGDDVRRRHRREHGACGLIATRFALVDGERVPVPDAVDLGEVVRLVEHVCRATA